jgi:DNA-binding transcriptional LysR family regulator
LVDPSVPRSGHCSGQLPLTNRRHGKDHEGRAFSAEMLIFVHDVPMEIRWLEAFVAVAEELHFGRAAQRINMAQSPLSQVIRKLERELGTPLFDRSTRVAALTAAGHALLPHARTVLHEIELGKRATAASAGEVYGTVAIGFSGVLNHLTLPLLTRAVRSRYPHIGFTLVARAATADAVSQIRSGALDLAFVGLPVDADLVASRLVAVEELGVVVPAEHPLAQAGPIQLRDLTDEAFVSMPQNPGSVLRERLVAVCLDAGFRPHIVQEVSDPYVVLSLVAAGVGVTLAPISLRSVLPAGCTYLALADQSPTLESGLAWRRDDRSVALRAVLQVAADVLPEPAARHRPRTRRQPNRA